MTGVRARYDTLIEAGELKPDVDQEKAVDALDALQSQLETAAPEPGFMARLFGAKSEPVRGLYMWGDVGRGKSMLMDLFYESVAGVPKRRAHFHEFMLDIHDRLRRERLSESGDPIKPVVAGLAEEARLLCFDEMVVNNMADAAIMSRLFSGMIEAGMTIVTTSNRVPDELYKNGLNRQLFLPCIDLIKDRLDILSLNGPTDYRLDRLSGSKLWHAPADDAATAALSESFFRLTDYPPSDRAHVPAEDIAVQGGRTMHVPKSLKGVAVFSFKRLCAEARGAPDYLSIARRYHTVIIVGIPKLGPENRNEAARFVTLIDALYEYKVKLLASAATKPADLYTEGDGAFEFQRTVSRLMEMQSDEYLSRGHGSEQAEE